MKAGFLLYFRERYTPNPMRRDHAIATARFIAYDVFGSFLYLPLWWYTGGLLRTARFCVAAFVGQAQSYGVAIWFKNLFVPMYGQRDLFGRAISVVLRFVVILFYSFLLIVYALILLGIFSAWILFPPTVGYLFFHQVTALFLNPV